MFERIIMLCDKGYYPDTILDIGAYHGNWTNSVKNIFSHANYYLFEAIDYSELNQFRNRNDTTVYNVVLNDKISVVDWYEMRNTGDSIFREKTHHFANCNIIKRETIDLNSIILRDNLFSNSRNIFVKIDCQGAEIPILKGSSLIYNKIDFIILEMPLFGQYNENVPNFMEHIIFMDKIGFVIYDIVDNNCYCNGFKIQVDVMFINKNHRFNTLVNELMLIK